MDPNILDPNILDKETRKRKPLLVVLCGLPGSGKSVVAREIAQRIDGVLLRTDVVRRELFPTRRYTEDETARVYEEILARSAQYLRQGSSVVLDGTFSKEKWRTKAREMADAAGVPMRLVEVVSSPEVVEARLAARTGDASEADVRVHREFQHSFEPIREPHIVIDNSKTLAHMQEQVRRFF